MSSKADDAEERAIRDILDMALGKPTESAAHKPPKGMHKVLARVEGHVRKYLVLPSEHAYVAVVLWIAHTHVYECFDTTPRLLLDSPTPGTGKTRVLEIIESLACKPLQSFSTSPAALIRTIDSGKRVTILLDEIDTFYVKGAGTEDITAIVNAGYKRGAKVPRCVGQGMEIEVVELNAFTCMVLAGLTTNVPPAVRSRSIHVRMRKRLPATEPLSPYRIRDAAREADPMKAVLETWGSSTITDTLADARPELPAGVEDRPAEVWEPLIAVADAIGGSWPERARAACTAFVFAKSTEGPTLGVEMLTAIRSIMDAAQVDEIATNTLIAAIRSMADDSPWPPGRGDLEPNVLARILRPFDVATQQFRLDGRKVRGYRRYGDGGLHDAFERYVESAEERGAERQSGPSKPLATVLKFAPGMAANAEIPARDMSPRKRRAK